MKRKQARIYPFGTASFVLLLLISGCFLASTANPQVSMTSPPAKADDEQDSSDRLAKLQGNAMFQSATMKLEKARRRKDSVGESRALCLLANCYFNVGAMAPAEKLAREGMAKGDEAQDPESSVQARLTLASILQVQGQDDKGILDEALVKGKPSPASTSDVLLELARYSWRKRNVNEAIDRCREAVKVLQDAKLPDYIASLVLDGFLTKQGKFEEALASYKRIEEELTKAQRHEDTFLLADTRLQLAGLLETNYAEYEKALEIYQSLYKFLYDTPMESADLDSSEKVQVTAQARIAGIMLKLQKPGDASNYLKKVDWHTGTELSESTSSSGSVDFLIVAGSTKADLGRFDEARKDHSAAAKLAAQLGYQEGELTALEELAYDELLQGRNEHALSKFQAACKFLDRYLPNAAVDKGNMLSYIGMCYQALGERAAAIRYRQLAAELFEKLGDTTDEALAYNDMAVACLDFNMFKEFESYYSKAKQLLESDKSGSRKQKLASAYLDYNYAQACVFRNRLDEALPIYERALSIYQNAIDPVGESRVLRGLGYTNLLLHQTEKATECYRKAATLANKQGYEAQWDCAVGLGIALREAGKAKEAEEQLRNAIKLVENERRQMSRDSFKTFNLDFRQECFLQLADMLASQNAPGEALEVAEQGRARAFVDMLERRQAGKLPSGTVAQISNSPDEIAIAPAPSAQPGKQTPETQSAAPTLVASADLGRSTFRSVEVAPKASSLVEPSAISPVHSDAPKKEEIISLAKESASYIVYYYVLPKKILVWVIAPDGTISTPPPIVVDKSQLAEKVQSTYRSIVTPPKSMRELGVSDRNRQNHLKELYKLLIEPIASHLPKSPDEIVTFVPHGPLYYVPFAALMSPDNHYLVEQHTVAYVPAIGVLRTTLKLQQELSGSKNTLLAFGNPITKAIASFVGKLPYSEKEVQAIATLFGQNDALVDIGDKATKLEFRKQAPSRSIIHLATHGLIDEERPMDSALVLAPAPNDPTDDGLFTVQDILQVPPLHAKLIVLSACQTGRGKVTGDGVVGLSRAFIIAGTPSVVVSQWNVDDVMTEYEMKQLYEAYIKGTAKAQALRSAQLKTIEFMEKALTSGDTSPSERIRANPRYWAAFQLIGEAK